MNLVGRFRSNYFAVADRPTFEEWCQRNGLSLIVSERDPELVGFVNSDNESGIPSTVVEERDGEEENVAIDFIGELGTFLLDNHVAIVIEIFHVGYRYLGGTAYAINNKGEQKRIDLDEIFTHAKDLGKKIEKCEY